MFCYTEIMHEQRYLDPLNDPVFPSSFAAEKKDLMYKAGFLQMYTWLPSTILILAMLLPIIAFIMTMTYGSKDEQIILYSAIPAITYLFYIDNVQNQLGLFLLAQKHNWAYNPAPDIERVKRFEALFPTVFKNPDKDYVDQHITDQLWGSITYKEQVDFWSGLFVSTVDQDRKRSANERTVIIIKLPKEIPLHAHFTLARHEKFHINLGNTIRTESQEFNILYGIKPLNRTHQTELEIFKLLSPSVQVRLIDFAHNYDVQSITFQHNCMVVLFNGKIWQTKHTNFFKRAIIDERDVKAFDDLIKSIVGLPAEMIKFLD